MISLKPITHQNIDDFDGTEYETMTSEQRRALIEESIGKTHNGAYFEFLVVYRAHTVIGFMNLYAHSAHIISCGPTIKEPYRKNGFGCLADNCFDRLSLLSSTSFPDAAGSCFHE